MFNSIALMTLADLVVLGLLGAGFAKMLRYRKTAAMGAALAMIGLGSLGLLYAADLYTMWVMPLYTPMAKAMQTMTDLHLEYSWAVILVAVPSLVVGVSSLCQVVYNQALELRADEIERRISEDRIRVNHGVLAQTEELANMGRFEWRVADNHLSWSRGLFSIYGLDAENHAPSFEDFMQRLQPESREMVSETVRRSLETHEPFEVREKVVRPSGEIRTLNTKGGVLLNEAGEVTKLVGVCYDITEFEKNEQELIQLSSEVLGAQEKERKRVATDLHDSALQTISAAKLSLTQSNEPNQQALSMLDAAYREIREICADLYPSMLSDLGLSAAIKWHANNALGGAVKVHYDIDVVSRMPYAIEINVYRIAQELISNIKKHSQATEARLCLQYNDEQTIELIVQDNGRGCCRKSGAEGKYGFGLANIRQRIRDLKGSMAIESPETGTRVKVEIPWRRNHA